MDAQSFDLCDVWLEHALNAQNVTDAATMHRSETSIRKLFLANMTVATIAAGALTRSRREATVLADPASARKESTAVSGRGDCRVQSNSNVNGCRSKDAPRRRAVQ